MKRKLIAYSAAFCLVAGGYVYAQDDAQPADMNESTDEMAMEESSEADAMTEMEKVSYAIAVQIATEFKSSGLELNSKVFAKGLDDVYGDKELVLSRAELGQVMQEFQQRIMEERQAQMAQQQEEMQGQMEENKAVGEEFLAENAKKDGVKATASGLQYLVLQEGEGASPDSNDTVRVHYHGKLLDGTVFDSSIDRGEPISFQLNRVIDGWQEGLQLMKEGARYRLFIPSNLAYKEMGSPPDIPPNSTLIFDVELLEVTETENPVEQMAP